MLSTPTDNLPMLPDDQAGRLAPSRTNQLRGAPDRLPGQRSVDSSPGAFASHAGIEAAQDSSTARERAR